MLHLRNRFIIVFIPLLAVTGCESGIVFNAPQPFGGEPAQAMPENLIGDYIIDTDKLENPDPDRKATYRDSLLLKHPLMSISKEAIIFYERRWDEIHEDSILNGSYQLRDEYLYHNNEKISKLPVDKRDSIYYYITRLDELAFPVDLDTTVWLGEGVMQLGLKSVVITGNDYFVLNIGVYDAPNRWSVICFQSTPDGKIAVKQPMSYDDIDPLQLKKTARILDLGKEYLVEVANEAEFLKVVSLYYKDLFVLKKASY